MREKWKDIEGFPGYQVSNMGRVRSFIRRTHKPKGYGADWVIDYDYPPRIVKASDDGNGYLKVMLYNRNDKKRYCRKVHSLVAEAFIPRVDGADTVDHELSGPEGKLDNSVKNLRWMSRRKNIQKAYRDGVCNDRIERSKKPVILTDIWTGEETYYESVGDAADAIGVHYTSISHALRTEEMKVSHYIVEFAGREEIFLHGCGQYYEDY